MLPSEFSSLCCNYSRHTGGAWGTRAHCILSSWAWGHHNPFPPVEDAHHSVIIIMTRHLSTDFLSLCTCSALFIKRKMGHSCTDNGADVLGVCCNNIDKFPLQLVTCVSILFLFNLTYWTQHLLGVLGHNLFLYQYFSCNCFFLLSSFLLSFFLAMHVLYP